MFPTIRIYKPSDLDCPQEYFDVVKNLLKTGLELRSVLEHEVSQLMNLKLQVSAKEMAKEDVRMNIAYLDGCIKTFSDLLDGEFNPPAVSTPDVKPEEN